MKSALFYYSTTGNTKLVCETIRDRIAPANFEVIGINDPVARSVDDYDLVGFACFTDQMQIPELMRDFIGTLSPSRTIPAFVLNTYGLISGKTLHDLKKKAKKRGFAVIDGVSVLSPENYPPAIKRGVDYTKDKTRATTDALRAFMSRLSLNVQAIAEKKTVTAHRAVPWVQRIMPSLPMFLSKSEMGKIQCDEAACTKCKLCEKGCPVQAIAMNPFPATDYGKCLSCWKCYNKCPSQAIVAGKFGSGHRYPKPDQVYRNAIKGL